MKDNKGAQVFSDKIDETLGAKIIEHTENNSRKFPSINSTPTTRQCFGKRTVTFVIATFMAIMFFFLFFLKTKHKSKR